MTAELTARRFGVLAGIAILASVAGCQTDQSGRVSHASALAPPAVQTPHVAAPRHARAATHTAKPRRQASLAVLPDRLRTPGATNPAVTPSTIRSTICRTGYTKTIRPPSSYTTGLKVSQLDSGYAYRHDLAKSDYEEDHLIPLELGGAPSDPRNLWPEPYAARGGARVKDLVENELHDLVCSGRLPLRTAQQAIARNWWRADQRYGGEAVPTIYYGAYASSSSAPSTSGTTSSTSGGATARCVDGTYSYSQHRSGTCSHHGGVAAWINPPPS